MDLCVLVCMDVYGHAYGRVRNMYVHVCTDMRIDMFVKTCV